MPDCIRAMALTEFPYESEKDDLISNIIYEGKILYFIEAMIPGMADHLIIGYPEDKIEWMEGSEDDMWTYLVAENLLFSTDYMIIRNMTGEAPFTKEFSKDSPPRAGIWLGWQLVRKYMANTGTSVQDLMTNNDYHDILRKSKYKPGIKLLTPLLKSKDKKLKKAAENALKKLREK